eukprot:gb/GECH01006109.1/.p1 GENE.gb/GECH01006109.1/~~gb/GECH01006109.1/.p1  ORF type:complete len:136 (+),score=17.69 gb/GECH01006109.1/:1-408(+)
MFRSLCKDCNLNLSCFFLLSRDSSIVCSDESGTGVIRIQIIGSLNGNQQTLQASTALSFDCPNVSETFQFTFLEADRSINGAHVTAPSDNPFCTEKPCPVAFLNPQRLPTSSSPEINAKSFRVELRREASGFSQE